MQATGKDPWDIHPWVAQAQQRVRMGVALALLGDWAPFHDCVLAAEELGFDSLWVPDHPMLLADCWTLLATLATTTKSIRLGSLVSCIFYRHAALLARIAADVDRLSHGRLLLGLGIGDQPNEFAQLGLPFPPVSERQEALEEVLHVVKGLWGTTPFTYRGKYVQVQQASLPFGPIQQPHIPLLIAGGGERVTLRQVAQYADASNFGASSRTGGASRVENVVRKCQVLHAHAEALGRPSRSILRTYLTLPLFLAETQAALATKQEAMPVAWRERFRSSMLAVTPREAIEHYRALIQAGIDYFIVGVWPGDVDTLHLLSQQVLPALAPT